MREFARAFKNDLTLDNLSRPQLQGLCKYVGVNSLGPNSVLRYLLNKKMREIKSDDEMIQKEGLGSLTDSELRAACRARGMRTVNVPLDRLRSELQQWLNLHLKYQIPATLLFLSRVFTLQDPSKANPNPDEALKTVLSTLPTNLVEEAQLQSAELTGPNEQRLEALKKEEALIKKEREEREQEQRKLKEQQANAAAGPLAQASDGESITVAQLKQLGEALAILTSPSAVEKEKMELAELKEDHEEVSSEVADMKVKAVKPDLHSASILDKRIAKMITNLEKEVTQVESQLGSKLNLIRLRPDGKVSVEELEKVLTLTRDHPDNESVKKIVRRLDVDSDGFVPVEEIVGIVEEHEHLSDGRININTLVSNMRARQVTRPRK